ncbi:MAG: hypothetical protein OEW27_09965 [Aquincola sp.]|nr:hypothetical protein [Aquincola sp.]
MPCKYVVVHEGRMIVEQWVGTIGYAELVDHKTRQRADPAVKAPASVLSDCTLADVEISPEAIDRLSDLEPDQRGQAAVQRYAFLVKPEVYQRAQRFADRVSAIGTTVRMFNNRDAACRWLDLDPAEVRALIASFGIPGS